MNAVYNINLKMQNETPFLIFFRFLLYLLSIWNEKDAKDHLFYEACHLALHLILVGKKKLVSKIAIFVRFKSTGHRDESDDGCIDARIKE